MFPQNVSPPECLVCNLQVDLIIYSHVFIEGHHVIFEVYIIQACYMTSCFFHHCIGKRQI